MRLLPLAAVLLLAALPARPEEPQASAEPAARAEPLFESLEKDILRERDPYTSKAFLDKSDAHAPLRRADPSRFDALFLAASQNVDLHRALLDHVQPGTLREAFAARDGFALLEKPADLLAWRKRYADFAGEDVVRGALLEWDTLSREVRAELGKAGRKAQDWGRLSFPDRAEALEAALSPAVERVKAAVARSPAEARALHGQVGTLWPYLDKDVRAALGQHMEKVDAGVAGLEQARRLAAKDPALAAKLAQARAAGSVDDLLGRLGGLFDGAGVRNAAVERAGPGRADQRLDDKGRAALSEMIKTGVLREMRGTAVGDRLARFYEKEPLNLVVKPLPPGIMGWHQNKDSEIAVNEDLILRTARQQGRTAQDLLTDPAAFDAVLKEVLSTIVHEAVHQEQAAWRRDGKLPHWDVVEHEIEAKSLEAAFVLEKASKDKAYAKFLAENQERSVFVRESAVLANNLRRSPGTFRMAIQADYYPSEVSIEANAARAYDDTRLLEWRRDVEAELARRDAMGPARRQATEAAGRDSFAGHVRSREAWLAGLRGIKSESLEAWRRSYEEAVVRRREQRSEVPGVYAAYRARDEETSALTTAVLTALAAAPLARSGEARFPAPPPVAREGGGGGGGGRR